MRHEEYLARIKSERAINQTNQTLPAKVGHGRQEQCQLHNTYPRTLIFQPVVPRRMRSRRAQGKKRRRERRSKRQREWQVAGEKVRGSLSIELDEVVAAGSIIEREYALVGTSGSLTLSLEWR